MKGTSEQFLASPGLTLDQNRTIALGDPRQDVEKLLYFLAATDDVFAAILFLQLLS